jgi:DedD protein
MKLVIDEQLKHRLIGIAVIVSLGAIFAPAIMKKSGQSIENKYSVQVKLPPKPIVPDVSVTDEKELFKTIKVARVKLPKVSEESQLPELAKAEMTRSDEMPVHETALTNKPEDKNITVTSVAVNKAATDKAEQLVTLAANTTPKVLSQPKQVAVQHRPVVKKPVQVAAHQKPVVKKPAYVASRAKPQVKPFARARVYAVQLASFSQLGNAQSLVNRLKNKGYKASYIRVSTRSGVAYKVYAGHSTNKGQVMQVKTQLSSSMQLNGFVVNTGVS